MKRTVPPGIYLCISPAQYKPLNFAILQTKLKINRSFRIVPEDNEDGWWMRWLSPRLLSSTRRLPKKDHRSKTMRRTEETATLACSPRTVGILKGMDTLEKRDDKQDPSWTKLNHGVTAFDMQHTSRREEEDSTRKHPAEIVVPAAPRSVNMSGHVEAESD